MIYNYLEEQLKSGRLTRREYDSILMAFEGIPLKNVSNDRLTRARQKADFFQERKRVFALKSNLIEAMVVFDIEMKIFDFSRQAKNIIAVIINAFLPA